MIRVLIADDHQMVIDGLIRIFDESGERVDVVDTASTGDELLHLLEVDSDIDVVILDINMPGMEGASTLKQIKEKYPEIKVLMLTMHNDADRIIMMMQNRAHGYLLKNKSGKALVDAVRALSKGNYYFPDDIQKIVFDSHIPKEFMEDELKRMSLTDREEEILRLLAQGHSAKQIAGIIHIASKTVESHKSNLMEKLKAKNVQDLVRFAVKNGYCPD